MTEVTSFFIYFDPEEQIGQAGESTPEPRVGNDREPLGMTENH
jgi:hypothetical protein